MLAALTIQQGLNDIVVSGGMESMSNSPKYLAAARFPFFNQMLIKLRLLSYKR